MESMRLLISLLARYRPHHYTVAMRRAAALNGGAINFSMPSTAFDSLFNTYTNSLFSLNGRGTQVGDKDVDDLRQS